MARTPLNTVAVEHGSANAIGRWTLGRLLASISVVEWRRVALLTLLAVVLVSLPYLVGALTPHPGTMYLGTHLLSEGDTPVYYSYIQAAKHGALLFRDVFTSEPHAAFNLNAIWVPIGWLSRLFNLSAPLAFHLARTLSIPIFTFVLYTLLSWWSPDARRRTIAFVLVCFASGLTGWFYGPLLAAVPEAAQMRLLPMDLWVPEAFPFLSFLQSPHFTIGTALILLVLAGTVAGWKTGQRRFSIGAGVSALLLFSFHPFHIVSLAVILAVWAAWMIGRDRSATRRVLVHLLIVALVAAPSVIVQAAVLAMNPIAAGRASQNILPTPQLPVMLVSYGLLLVGAMWALRRRATWQQERLVLPALWLLVGCVTVYLPIFFQRRLVQGLSIPFALLTAETCVWAWERLRWRWTDWRVRTTTVGALALLLFSTNIVTLGRDITYLGASRTRAYPYAFYLPNEYQQVANTLRARPGSVTLTAVLSGDLLAGLSGQTVYLGHPVETLHYRMKRDEVTNFFADRDPRGQTQFLKDHHITHVLWGDWERALGPFDPTTKPYLTLVFNAPTVSLYSVR